MDARTRVRARMCVEVDIGIVGIIVAVDVVSRVDARIRCMRHNLYTHTYTSTRVRVQISPLGLIVNSTRAHTRPRGTRDL